MLQDEVSLSPPASWVLPASQSEQLPDPAAEYRPTAQSVQADPSAENLPTAQVMEHVEEPCVEYLPISQLVQDKLSISALNLPGTHDRQGVVSSCRPNPTWHAQDAEPTAAVV